MKPDVLALILRTYVLYPLGGWAAALFSGLLTMDPEAGTLTLDLHAGSVLLAVLITGGVSTATFSWSRFIKRKGGAT